MIRGLAVAIVLACAGVATGLSFADTSRVADPTTSVGADGATTIVNHSPCSSTTTVIRDGTTTGALDDTFCITPFLTKGCKSTPASGTAPTRALADLSGTWWVQNHVWVAVAGDFHGAGFRAVPAGQKVAWYRERPGSLRVYAKRLDPSAPAEFKSDVPSGYRTIGFQPSGLTFGAPGCWALTAVVGTQRARFVVVVSPADR